MAHRSTKTRTALVSVTTLALALGASACSGSTSDGSSAGGKTFTYWSMWKEGEPQQKVIAAAIADFEKQSGDKVNVQWVGRQNITKLTAALNTHNVPDLVDGSWANTVPALVNTDQALGLSGAFADKTADGETASSVIPEKYTKSVDINLPSGQPWMLPYNVQTDAFWFNAAKYPELKTNPPKTWAEFITLLDKFKSQGVAPIAADGDVAGYNTYWITTLIDRTGGPGTMKTIASDKTGQAWKAPDVLAAAQKLEQLVKGGYFINGYTASKFPYQQTAFANNKAALIMMGSWLPTEAAAYEAPGFIPDSFPFPTTGTADSQRLDLSGFVVPKKAKNTATAQQFAAFFLGKKYQTMWAANGGIPLRTDVSVGASAQSEMTALKGAKTFHQINDGITFTGYATKVLNPADDQLFLGKITPQQFVDTMASTQADYWKSQS